MECPECRSENPDDSHFCRMCGTELPASREILSSRTEPLRRQSQERTIGSSFLGRYHIIEELGRGGMGVVYRAEDTKLKRHVALKFLPSALTRDVEAKERFVHEAQAASALDHPNICTIYEIDETADGQMFICMGCYDGETLKKKIERGPLKPEEAVDIALQLAQGLGEAHEKGIVHRDIKPSNIIITARKQAKIMDFGLAKLAGQTRLTKAGTTMGTVAYMSPEQTYGQDVDERTDIWSLGVVLYEMLTGQLPFRGEYDQAVVYSILNEEPKPIRELTASVPLEFEAIVNRCLRKDLTERYQSAADLEADLRRLRKDTSLRTTVAGVRAGSTRHLLLQNPRRVVIPAGVVILALVLLSMLPSTRKAVRNMLGLGTHIGEMRVALLPCNFPGGTREDRAFCDGLIKTMTDKLAELERFCEAFWVVASTDIQGLGSIGPTEARRHLGANVVITGSMKRRRERIQLLLVRNDLGTKVGGDADTESLTERRSPPITDPIANLATWQDSVIIRLVELLDLDLTPQSRHLLFAGGTTVPQAYELYLQAVGYLYPYENDQRIDSAIGSFGRAVEQDSSFALAFLGLANAYLWKHWKTKDIQWADLAVGACERALQANPQMASAHSLLGNIHKNTGNYEQAIVHFQRSLQVDAANFEAYDGMGYVYRALGDLERAEMAYRKAIELRPRASGAYHELGFLYYQQGRYEDAIEPFLKLIELKPQKTAGYTNLGAAYFQLERWVEGREMFERSLAIDSTYLVCSNLGTIYFAEARYADAARMYRKALSISGDSYQVWGHLAESYYWTPGEAEKARENFQRAVRLAEEELKQDPLDPAILACLASYYERLGHRSQAESLLKEVVAQEPADPVVIFSIAETYEQLGERESALEWIGRALDKGAPLAKVNRYPGLRKLRADQRYKRLLVNMEE